LDFLWETRQASIYKSNFWKLHLQRIEMRLDAHLDGLREAGVVGQELASKNLKEADSYSLATAAGWTLLGLNPPFVAPVIAALTHSTSTVHFGLRHALRHSNPVLWLAECERLVHRISPSARAVIIDASTFHRIPISGSLENMRQSEDSNLRGLLWGIRLRCGPPPTPTDLRVAVEDDAADVRTLILQCAARWGMSELRPFLREMAARGDERMQEAVFALGAWGNPEDLSLLKLAVEQASVRNAALRGIGALGCTEGVPVLLAGLEDTAAAPAAGEAFTALTGEPLGLVEGSLFDESVNVPDAQEAKRFWKENSRRFEPSKRWRGGKAVHTLTLRDALAVLDLEGGRDAYLRECLRSKGQTLWIELERFACERGRELEMSNAEPLTD
jgi:uncharacterized protein (TIGR02270 family)